MILFVEYFFFFGINVPFPNPDQLWEARSLLYRLFRVNPLTHKLYPVLLLHYLMGESGFLIQKTTLREL